MIPLTNSNFVKRCQLSAFACAIVTATIGIDFTGTKSLVQAQTIPATCPLGTETVTYSPSLTDKEKYTTASISGSVGGCMNAGGITSGTYSFSFSGPTSCNDIGFFPTYEITYKWNTGKTSTVRYTSTSSNVIRGQIILTSYGNVRAGNVFNNRPVIKTLTLATTKINACSTTGLSFITGPQTLTILPALP